MCKQIYKWCGYCAKLLAQNVVRAPREEVVQLFGFGFPVRCVQFNFANGICVRNGAGQGKLCGRAQRRSRTEVGHKSDTHNASSPHDRYGLRDDLDDCGEFVIGFYVLDILQSSALVFWQAKTTTKETHVFTVMVTAAEEKNTHKKLCRLCRFARDMLCVFYVLVKEAHIKVLQRMAAIEAIPGHWTLVKVEVENVIKLERI